MLNYCHHKSLYTFLWCDVVRLCLAAQVREGTWKVAPLPADLLDRRVEITGPTDRKMVRSQACT